MGGSYGGYLTTLLHRPHDAVRRRDQRARVHRPGELRRVLRHRLELPRPVPRHRSRRGSRRRARWPPRPDHHADAGHPLRGGLALPARAGGAALRRAQAPRRPVRAAAVPGGGPRAVPVRPAAAPAGPPRARPALVGPLAPDPANGTETAELEPATVAGGTRVATNRPPNRCRCGPPGSTDPPRRSPWQGVRPWWSDGCPAGRSCGELVAAPRVSPATRRTGGWPGPAVDRRPPGDRPPAHAARGVRLRRRRRRRRDQPAPVAGGVRRGWSSAPARCATCRGSTRRRPCSARRAALPFAFAPTGFTRMMHHEGEIGGGRVAERVGVPYALSTMGTTSMEALADGGADARGAGSSCTCGATGRPATTSSSGRTRPATRRWCSPSTPRSPAPGCATCATGSPIPPALTLRTLGDMSLHPRWWFNLLTTQPLEFASLTLVRGAPSPSSPTRCSTRPRPSPTWRRCGRPGPARWSSRAS